ncbi:MAG: hypothetical protein IJ571_09745 [Ruminococcus sp.]|nr:hypothetical protein [Ruminococcus sp.]
MSLTKRQRVYTRAIGIVLTVPGALMVLFSVFILIFGSRSEARFTKYVILKKGIKVMNHYEYIVDGETYEFTDRVDRDDAGKEGDTVIVRYLSFAPNVNFDRNVLIIGSMLLVFGVLIIGADRDNE